MDQKHEHGEDEEERDARMEQGHMATFQLGEVDDQCSSDHTSTTHWDSWGVGGGGESVDDIAVATVTHAHMHTPNSLAAECGHAHLAKGCTK